MDYTYFFYSKALHLRAHLYTADAFIQRDLQVRQEDTTKVADAC